MRNLSNVVRSIVARSIVAVGVGELLLLLAVASTAVAQSSDWQVLQGIPAGTKVKLILKRRRTFGYCELEQVTNDGLGCYFSALGSRLYARDDVREVRLGHHAAVTGFFIGAGAGAILGAANGSGGAAGRGFYAVILTPVMGGFGAGIGAIVDPFLHGKTVYRSPDVKAGKQPAQPQSPTEQKEPESPVQR